MHIIRCVITAAYMCARDRMTTPFVAAIHITLVDCNQLHHVDIYIYIYIPSHRTCPSSATRRRWPRARRLAKTRMLVGSTASYRPASPTTRLSPTNASEDYVTIAQPLSVYRLCNHYTSTICRSQLSAPSHKSSLVRYIMFASLPLVYVH